MPVQFDDVEINGFRVPEWVGLASFGLAWGVMLGVALIALGAI